MKTRIIAITNNKGGVAKTTSTLNISKGIANHNKNVLMIDLDPQASLTKAAGIDTNQVAQKNISQVLKNEININDTLIKIDNLYLIPSHLTLTYTNSQLIINGGIFRLKNQLDTIKDNFDYIVIDTPPSVDNLTLNGLIASTEIFIPIQAEYMALQGTQDLINYLMAYQKEANNPNINFNIANVFLTMANNTNLSNEIEENIKAYFQNRCFQTKIKRNIALAEAPATNSTIYDYKKDSSGATDYNNLVEEIIKQEQGGMNE